MTELTKEALEQALAKQTEVLKTYTDEQTQAIGRMINHAFQEHQDGFLQERFERLDAQLSLSAEVKTLRVDFTALQKEVEALKGGKLKRSGASA
jgi:hypothetical protein